MGAEESIHVRQGGVNSLYELALLDALREALEESQIPSEQFEHAWDPEDCSPKFRVLRDRLTARRLPSPLTTDAIRGMFLFKRFNFLKSNSAEPRDLCERPSFQSGKMKKKRVRGEGVGEGGMKGNNSILRQA